MSRAIPDSTYRLQFNKDFTFLHALDLVDYFKELGISHYYASPLFYARPSSTHGYDIIDHSQLNPEIGSRQDFETLAHSLQEKKMGLIMDIVPNHMFIASSANKWWNEVLENGPSSKYAQYFDIDWNSPRSDLVNRVLLPFLDQQYGDALENQSLQVQFHEGAFFIALPHVQLPTDPKTWVLILELWVKEALKNPHIENEYLLELQSIITALLHLPATTERESEKIEERHREKEVIKRRLHELITNSPEINDILNNLIIILNGKKGQPKSFDWLETFINAQPYRLCFWRVANDEINFRRFFEIFEFAGIKTEIPEVFNKVHTLIFDLYQNELIDGVRIDHIDGLWDPYQYLIDLNENFKKIEENKRGFYLVAEKILIGDEKLRSSWQLDGSVGYDYMNQLNNVFIDTSNKKNILDFYRKTTDSSHTISEIIFLSKKLILLTSMSSELYVLSRRLDRISEQHRSSRDFTEESLRSALRDVIACFPVYRSYVRAHTGTIDDEDRKYILTAIQKARRLNPATNTSIFEFLQDVLLLEIPLGLTEEQILERMEFVMHFQQLTGPVMAKGLEDTASYRYFPLASINEVGSDLETFGCSIHEFHKKNLERLPHTMLATSTHDTKRSEDVRARINVISEIPSEWEEAFLQWQKLNLHFKHKEGEDCYPDSNEEYLLYQTLIGSWPLEKMDNEAFDAYKKRIKAYMEKATREAKVHTSWINPNKVFDEALQTFIDRIFENQEFIENFSQFVSRISLAGLLNSLSQVILKLTSPGVPDIYQGNEIWDFSLVDPDNRRCVDYEYRKKLIKNLPENINELMKNAKDPRLKLFLTKKLLHLRQEHSLLFSKGEYVPLTIVGEKENNIIAYARKYQKQTLIILTTRFFTSLINDEGLINAKVWRNTQLNLPKEFAHLKFRDLLTEQPLESFSLDQIFKTAPFALLSSF